MHNGSLYPVLAAALSLAQHKRSGALKIKCGLERATLWFDLGNLIAVEAGSLGETLGRVLWMQGVLAPEQYANALDLMTDRPGKRLGEVLGDASIVPNDKVLAGLHLQTLRKAVRCLEWQAASTEIASSEGPPAHKHRTTISVAALAQEMAARMDEADLESHMAPVRALFAKLAKPLNEVMESARLTSAMRPFLLRLVAGGDRLGDVTAAGDEEQERMLVGLLLADCITLGEAPMGAAWAPSMEIEGGFDEEVSGLRASVPVPPPSSSSDLPDSSRPGVDPNEAARSGGTLGRMRLNRVTLSLRKIPEREARDDRDARLLAELHYINAMTLAKIGHWERSLVESERAVLHYPRGLEYAVLLGRAKWKLAQGAEQKASTQSELQELLDECVESEPTMALAYFVRAEILLEGDNDSEAERNLRKALRLNPRLSEAQQRLKVLERRRSSVAPSDSRMPAALAPTSSQMPAAPLAQAEDPHPISGIHAQAAQAQVPSVVSTAESPSDAAASAPSDAPNAAESDDPDPAPREMVAAPPPSVRGHGTTSSGGRTAIVVFVIVALVAIAVAYWRFRG